MFKDMDTGLIADSPELRSMASAPRDGSIIVVIVKNYTPGTFEARHARVVTSWVTDEFIPMDIAADDSEGMNHGALPEHICLGWLPI
jgi:hypothetical protein